MTHDHQTASVPTALEAIVASTKRRVEVLRRSKEALGVRAVASPRRSLSGALRSGMPAIIAEIKRASPSKGVFRADFDHLQLAAAYRRGGAAAISVVTEPDHFMGNGAWIAQVREATGLPVLRKDFIIDAIQIAESTALGADAILLIARILTLDQMKLLAKTAFDADLEVLFEAHDAGDLQKIDACAPAIVGVNVRNLDTFQVDRNQFEKLADRIPSNAFKVAESGIETPDDIRQCAEWGYQGFLIGESLIRSSDPEQLLKRFRGEGRP